MLFEKTTYLDDFPINISIAKVSEYPLHYHQDVEFVYVLKGEIWLKNVCHHYLLKEGDIFTNSGNEVHGLTATDKDNIVAFIRVSNRFFTQYFPALSGACFMTYVRDNKDPNLDALRKMLLQILLDYYIRSFNYKFTCIKHMIEIIKHLNLHFNLFAFDGQVVTNFKSDNPVAVERISRIINYVYKNHSDKISLKDLAEKEHLNEFYLSHLIRDCMGINFQEFLCFARAEMSEIPLLGTTKKVSTIARDVGFSTTAYYNKFFTKWFGHTPEEHRKIYSHRISSADCPAVMELLSVNQAIALIKRSISAEKDQEKSASVVGRLHLAVEVDPAANPIRKLQSCIEVIITPEDYHVMGDHLFYYLSDLHASRVIIMLQKSDCTSYIPSISDAISDKGYEVSLIYKNNLSVESSFVYDSVASAIHLFQQFFASKEGTLSCSLRDQGNPARLLKGHPSCITSCMVPKPSYYACRMIKNMSGELLYWSKYFYVVRNSTTSGDFYVLVAMNFNDEIMNLSSRKASAFDVNDIVNNFKDELIIDFTLSVEEGTYIIAKYALSNTGSIFQYMSHLQFPEEIPFTEDWIHMLNTEPQAEVFTEHVNHKLSVSSAIFGAGIQIIVIQKLNNQQ